MKVQTVVPAISGCVCALTHLRKLVFFDLNLHHRIETTQDTERSQQNQQVAQQLLAHVPQLLVVRLDFEQWRRNHTGLGEIVIDEPEEWKSTDWWN